MTTCLGMSFLFGSLCLSFVNLWLFVCASEDGIWDFIVLIPGHCLSLYFALTKYILNSHISQKS